jgi:hypothetical protein
MDIAIVFEWFAWDSLLAAEIATDPVQREAWLRLAMMWAGVARRDGARRWCRRNDDGGKAMPCWWPCAGRNQPWGLSFSPTRRLEPAWRRRCWRGRSTSRRERERGGVLQVAKRV